MYQKVDVLHCLADVLQNVIKFWIKLRPAKAITIIKTVKL